MSHRLSETPRANQGSQSLDRRYSRGAPNRLRRLGTTALIVAGLGLASLGVWASVPSITQVSAHASSSVQVANGSTQYTTCPSGTLIC